MDKKRIGGRCFIFGALDVKALPQRPVDGDYVIAADRGYTVARSLGITPDLVVGDFDSLGEAPDLENIVRLNVRKDDTDLEHAVRIALDRGYGELIVYGAVGGALDHTLGNIAVAEIAANAGARAVFIGDDSAFAVVCDGDFTLPKRDRGRVSVLSLSDVSHGVTITGLSYEVSEIDLPRATTLGVSNAFVGREAAVSVLKGTLLIVWETE